MLTAAAYSYRLAPFFSIERTETGCSFTANLKAMDTDEMSTALDYFTEGQFSAALIVTKYSTQRHRELAGRYGRSTFTCH